MKKIALLLFLIFAFACLTVACKPTNIDIAKIEIIETKDKYSVGETINYQEIKIRVTYVDDSTKEGSVKELGATIKTQADLSKEGETSYAIELNGKVASKNINIITCPYPIDNYQEPAFWLDYQNNIKGSSFEDDSKFIDSNAMYEVGNLNKFIFSPVLEYIDSDFKPTQITQAKTKTKVYLKSSNGTYGNPLEGAELDRYVSFSNNEYQFTEDAGGNIFKLEISLDAEAYILGTGLNKTTISIEFIVVDGGYNVYEQNGLAVMTDAYLDSIWEEILGRNSDNPLQLPADNQPLYKFVGNVDFVILHGSILLDPELVPSCYFWSKDDVAFTTAQSNISPIFEGKVKLEGSLKDGNGEASGYETAKYINNEFTVGDANMQMSLYATTKASFSGNYFDIKVPTVDNTNNTDKRFYTTVWYESKNSPNSPISHWSIFKVVKSRPDYANEKEFAVTFKNCSMTGNNGKSENNIPAGMMMLNSAVDELTFQNIIGTSFYVNLTLDNYGMGSTDRPFVKSYAKLIKSKFLDSYSNMITTWRGTFDIVESALKRAGGPLFIMMDGNRTNGETNDTKGPNIKVDSKSKLEAFSSGNENWYTQNNAQALVMGIKQMAPLFEGYFEKTIFTGNNNSHINTIAAIIPDPADIMNPSVDNIEICGSFTQFNADNQPIATYAMHNQVMQTLKALSIKTYVFQSGNNFAMASTANGQPVLVNANNVELQQDFIQNGANSTIAQWRTTSTDTLCIYMAANLESARFPYFGVILGFGDKTQ